MKKYSIILIVKNDPGIRDSLARLKDIVADMPSVEVLVIDASKPEELEAIKKQNDWVRWIYFTNTANKRLTIPEQRNLGIDEAKGHNIIFLDANCVPSKSWFKTIELAFNDPDVSVITGPIKSIGDRTAHDAGYEVFQDGQVIRECGAANLAVRKKALRSIQGFDTSLSYGEDVDLIWRLQQQGYRLVFKKSMVISHDWGNSSEELRRAFRYGMSRTALYKKHRYRWGEIFTHDINMLIYPGFILGLPLTLVFPYYPLLLAIPLLKNYRNDPLRKTLFHFIYGAGAIYGIYRKVV